MKTEIYSTFEQVGDQYKYTVKFSDNPYTMVLISTLDICNRVAERLNERIDKFFSKKTNTLKTSDLGFQYIKN